MEYLKLISELRKKKLYIFSLEDITNLFPDQSLKTLKNNLLRWMKQNRFIRLKRDLYEFVEPGAESKITDLYVANRLYEPSYVSLETALSIYSIIPDIAIQVTSVTTRPTRNFRNKYGLFLYRTCRKRAFTGYRLVSYGADKEAFLPTFGRDQEPCFFTSFRNKVLMADKEKAFVDFLYYRLRSGNKLDFKEERFEEKILKGMDWSKMLRYAALFNNRTLELIKDYRRLLRC